MPRKTNEPSHFDCNRGAEIWFEAKRLIEERKMILPDDPVFIQQPVGYVKERLETIPKPNYLRAIREVFAIHETPKSLLRSVAVRASS